MMAEMDNLKDRQMEVMIGNFAIARGLVEAGLDLATAYPGTPSSEIIPGVIEFNRREKGKIYAEWSTNERCALEVAFGAASIGRKAACMMKQVGLNVAFPALLHGRERPLKGALVIVSCDDPGPQSSQTEQDTRLLATLFNTPVFDPASPREAADVAYYAMHYSYEHKVPVILRSTHRVSHAREAVPLFAFGKRKVVLAEGVLTGRSKAGGLRLEAEDADFQLRTQNSGLRTPAKLGIVASGMSYSIAVDVISGVGLEKDLPVYKITRIPGLRSLGPDLTGFVDRMEKILVLEETESVIESILGSGEKVLGRRNGYVPGTGELTYEVIRQAVEKAVEGTLIPHGKFVPDSSIEEALKSIPFPPRPPKLCAGCPHRATFYAMQCAYPEAIFPGDIGCYTLGTSMGTVDTFVDMGSGVTLASGFYDTSNQDGTLTPIVASVGDSTFFHACLEPLYDAAKKGKRFILVIMDNSTTAMTGMQPTPQSGITAGGAQGGSVRIEDVVKSFGVDFLKIVDPFDVPLTIKTMKNAYAFLEEKGRGPAVIIARRECALRVKGLFDSSFLFEDLEEHCTGCKQCIKKFECPALVFNEEAKRIKVDAGLCTQCGMCLYACPSHEKGKEVSRLRPKRRR
jgi:indolepyruvate ferredoxin oxidoreductase, alpha subunit